MTGEFVDTSALDRLTDRRLGMVNRTHLAILQMHRLYQTGVYTPEAPQ